MLFSNNWVPLKTAQGNSVKTIHIDALPQMSEDFMNVQLVDTVIKKVYAVINLNKIATIVGVAEPASTTTKTVVE
jgi:hypothetical protein